MVQCNTMNDVFFLLIQVSTDVPSSEASVAVAVVLTFLFTFVLRVSLTLLCVYMYIKWKRSGEMSVQQETEMKPTVLPIYEEPEDFKPEPVTGDNVAYGHVH